MQYQWPRSKLRILSVTTIMQSWMIKILTEHSEKTFLTVSHMSTHSIRHLESAQGRIIIHKKCFYQLIFFRGQRIKVGDSGYNLPGGQDHHRSFLMAQFSHPGDIMAEYDSPSHMPDGVTNNMWERLVVARRKKVENEHKVFQLENHWFLKVLIHC